MALNASREGMFMLITQEQGCLSGLPTGKERCYADLHKGGITPSHGSGCYLPGKHSGAPAVFSLKRKPVSCCFWIQGLLTTVWRNIPPRVLLPPFLSLFARLVCLTEHIHCSLPCTKPSDSFLKWLRVSVCT